MTIKARAFDGNMIVSQTEEEAYSIGLGVSEELSEIYRLRHMVYAEELAQHPINSSRMLKDALDERNMYIVTKQKGKICGFISITPPQAGSYSVEKYFAPDDLRWGANERVYELRLLTVRKSRRKGALAALLMYAAFRWVESHRGTRIVAIGRREVLSLYLRVGLLPTEKWARSGAVDYQLLHAPVTRVSDRIEQLRAITSRMAKKIEWNLPFPFEKPARCFHGGAFFVAIGEDFRNLDRKNAVINADVLDAWFPPSPKVLTALNEHLDWLVRTSPPTQCEGLIQAVAEARSILPQNILPGAGSSDLIFGAFLSWLSPQSRVLLLDPTYGEYLHVLQNVIGCQVDRLLLSRKNNYDVDLDELRDRFRNGYDLVILVNPNSPTGRVIPKGDLQQLLKQSPLNTRIWIDETYTDFLASSYSLECFAAESENVIVAKSMSKAYALSGMRVAYLCGGAHQLESLRSRTPPWVVGLPAQLAAAMALRDPDYYSSRYAETKELREQLGTFLGKLGCEITPGCANFLLAHLPCHGPTASQIITRCRRDGLFVRNAAQMGTNLGNHAMRIAVKDAPTQERMAHILARALTRN